MKMKFYKNIDGRKYTYYLYKGRNGVETYVNTKGLVKAIHFKGAEAIAAIICEYNPMWERPQILKEAKKRGEEAWNMILDTYISAWEFNHKEKQLNLNLQ